MLSVLLEASKLTVATKGNLGDAFAMTFQRADLLPLATSQSVYLRR